LQVFSSAPFRWTPAAVGRVVAILPGRPRLDISHLRVDRAEAPTVLDALFLKVDWPLFLPREGEGVEILEDFEAQTVESVGYDADGSPLVHLGRVVLDDLQVKQLRKMGWRAEAFPEGPTR
jgi:hypothetical protein